MQKKAITFKTKGMNQDLSASAFNPEFSFENVNLRLTTNESNTSLSWVNEKGTRQINVTIEKKSWNIDWAYGSSTSVSYLEGMPIGTAIINHKLVVFTTLNTRTNRTAQTVPTKPDYIYILNYTSPLSAASINMEGYIFYRGNLGFNSLYPLETFTDYEAEHIQKVYWTDGLNQPRLLNLKENTENLERWSIYSGSAVDSYFDFVPKLALNEDVQISPIVSSSSIFAPGTIQYCCTYIHKYGQQSNIFYTSPLYYLVHSDRGAAPDEKVVGGFKIRLKNLDNNFDYVRIYSIQRTSLDATPIVKLLEDVKYGHSFISFTPIPYEGAGVFPCVYDAEETRFKDVEYEPESYTYNIKIDPINGFAGVLGDNITFANAGVWVYDHYYALSPAVTYDSCYLRLNQSRGELPTTDLEDSIVDLMDFLKCEKYQYTYTGNIRRYEEDGPILIDANFFNSIKANSPLLDYLQPREFDIFPGEQDNPNLSLDQIVDPNSGFQEYFVTPQYAGFQITGGLLSYIETLLSEPSIIHSGWAFRFLIDGSYTTVYSKDLIDAYILYNYADHKWYLSKTLPQITDNDSNIEYLDNGTTGSTLDPQELLYLGGKEITVASFATKSNSLFMGNISQKNTLVSSIQDWVDEHRDIVSPGGIPLSPIEFKLGENTFKTLPPLENGSYYNYANSLRKRSLPQITTFKGGDTYRFGFQLQKKTGEWTEPIYLNDVRNTVYPNTSGAFLDNENIRLVYAQTSLQLSQIAVAYGSAFYDIFAKVRPVIVYPEIADREVICQGVVNPTVFNVLDRTDNSPYAQPSWFFRPYNSAQNPYGTNIDLEGKIVVENSSPTSAEQEQQEIQQEYFESLGKTAPVYILIVGISGNTDQIQSVLRRKYVERVMENYNWPVDGKLTTFKDTSKEPFDGAIFLKQEGTQSIYALIRSFEKGEWAKEFHYRGALAPVYSKCYYLGVEIKGYVESAITIYTGLQKTIYNLYYYLCPTEKEEDANFSTYILDFEMVPKSAPDTTVVYKITFSPPLIPGIQAGNTKGSPVEFKHYSSLYSYDKTLALDNKEDKLLSARDIEIEGSTNVFSDILLKENEKDKGFAPDQNAYLNVSTNTQFVVDQNIITLNSPDLEYDTKVQSQDIDNLKLRIVGVIPITGSASGHHITLGSAMLENHYGLDNKWVEKEKSGLRKSYFGKGELGLNNYHSNMDSNAFRHLVTEFMWEDVAVYPRTDDKTWTSVITGIPTLKHAVYPWHRKGSLNNDFRTEDQASSLLKTKKLSNLLFSKSTEYFNSSEFKEYSSIDVGIHLTENAENYNIRLGKQSNRNGFTELNIYPNIDKILYNSEGYTAIIDKSALEENYEEQYEKLSKLFKSATSHNLSFSSATTLELNPSICIVDPLYTPISMRYKSTSHAIISLQETNNKFPIMPYGTYKVNNTVINVGKFNLEGGRKYPYWNTNIEMSFSQESIDLDNYNSKHFGFLWLAELYKDVDPDTIFGGKTKAALRENKWYPCGESVSIDNSMDSVTLRWTYGDTYYQRYDCLKTYAYTPEDTNQIIEILSFMCETHVNIDGRYDRNRGQQDNTDMSPKNFNILNPVYSQQDTLFGSRILDTEDLEALNYPTSVYFTKTKNAGAIVDEYTNVNLGSIEELDGEYGKITSMKNFNGALLAFQEKGISQVLFNESTALTTTIGVPIEIANSGKVQGHKYISQEVGCINKWSTVQTSAGIYFIDAHSKNIYRFNGSLENLSVAKGFNTWSKKNISEVDVVWNPDTFSDFVSYYDEQNHDVLFIKDFKALAYSELTDSFTSFYDYGGIPYFCNFEGSGVWLTRNSTLWKHRAGDYCKFFGTYKPFSITYLGNPEPQVDKVFTNIEMRATVATEGNNGTPYLAHTPFDYIEAWNDYQHGVTELAATSAPSPLFMNQPSLSRKFRIWRGDIPRDNLDPSEEYISYVKRFAAKPLDRMRNPWLYIKLGKEQAYYNKVELHDTVLTYFS